MGKPQLNDLRSGLATAPVLYAAEEHPELLPLIQRRFKEVRRAGCCWRRQKRRTPWWLRCRACTCSPLYNPDIVAHTAGRKVHHVCLGWPSHLVQEGDVEAAQALVEGSSGLQRTRQLAAFHSGEAAAAIEAMSPAGGRRACWTFVLDSKAMARLNESPNMEPWATQTAQLVCL